MKKLASYVKGGIDVMSRGVFKRKEGGGGG